MPLAEIRLHDQLSCSPMLYYYATIAPPPSLPPKSVSEQIQRIAFITRLITATNQARNELAKLSSSYSVYVGVVYLEHITSLISDRKIYLIYFILEI